MELQEEEEVKKIAINRTRRPLSSNVFSVKRKEGEFGDSSVARDKPANIREVHRQELSTCV